MPSSTSPPGPGSRIPSPTRRRRSRRTSPRRSALLDAARLAGVGRFVFASSNAAAGDHPPPADETDLPHPVSPYGASKLAGEAYCQAYAATYGLAACALRFSNAYGPFSLHKKSVVAAWMRAAFAGEPITINGDGEQTRDFVYVGDLAAAVVAALDAPAGVVAGEIFQAGTGRETTVNELAETIGRAAGRPLEIRHGPGSRGRHPAEREPGRQGRDRGSATGPPSASRRVSPGRRAGTSPHWPTGTWPRSCRRPCPARTRPAAMARGDGRPAEASARSPIGARPRRRGHDRDAFRAGDPHLRHGRHPRQRARPRGEGPVRARPALLAARRDGDRVRHGPGDRRRHGPWPE